MGGDFTRSSYLPKDTTWFSQLGTKKVATGIYCTEARGKAKYPTMHRTAPTIKKKKSGLKKAIVPGLINSALDLFIPLC